MKKFFIILGVGLLVATAAIFLIFSRGSELYPPKPEIQPTAVFEPIVSESSVFIPVNISAELISNTIEQQVPRSFSQTKRLDIGGPVRQERVELSGSRQSLRTTTGPNGVSVSGAVNPVRARIRGYLDLLVGKKSFSQTINGNINFSLSAKPVFLSNWKIDPNLQYKFNVPKMETKIAKVGKVSVRGKTTEALNEMGAKFQRDYRDNFPLNDDFKTGAQDLWSKAHQVVEIYDAPQTWLVTSPISIQVIQPKFSETSMTLGLGMRINNQILVQENMPEQELLPFPETLEIIAEPTEDNLEINIPIALDFSTLNSAASKEIGLRKPKIEQTVGGETIVVQIEGLNLIPSGNGLIVELDIKSSSGGFFGDKASGKIYLLATPFLDKASKKLKFLDLDYHAETKSTIGNAAAFLLKPIVLSELENELTLDLQDLEQQAIDKAKEEIIEINQSTPEGVAIKLDPNAIDLNEIIVGSDNLNIVLAVDARLDVKIDDTFFISPPE